MTPEELAAMQAVTTRGVGGAPLPDSYKRAAAALRRCLRVDECATWTDKAAAAAGYRRQALEAEAMIALARQIRARAIRRVGELLDEMDRALVAHRAATDAG